MSELRRTERWPALLAVGAVEAVVAIAFGSVVFVGSLDYFLAEGIGLYLGAAVLTLGILAWRAGPRRVVGGLHATSAATVSLVAATAALNAIRKRVLGLPHPSSPRRWSSRSCAGSSSSGSGLRRLGNLVRFVPYQVVGGFLAGTGWLLLRGGIYVAFAETPYHADLAELIEPRPLRLWLPAFAFGVILLLAVRIVKRPLVIPR